MNLAINSRFWIALDELANTCEIKIERPKGSQHPIWPEIVYPLNYGYLAGSKSGDGNEIDVWLGSLPEKLLTAIAITVDTHKMDSEIKLLLGCNEEEISLISAFHNAGSQSALVLLREFSNTNVPS